MKKIIITSVLTSLLVVVAISFILPNKLNIDKDYYYVGGVIRNVGEGWQTINDDGHEPINISKIETTDKAVIVSFPKANKVVSFNVTPDETMASEGYTMGASVGLDTVSIRIYDKDHNLINPNDYKNEFGNIWVNGVFKE